MDAFVRKIDNYIKKNGMLHCGDRVVMGVSGGADSVALMMVMCELKEAYSLSLKVVHVNHGLRPEAVTEAEYVESLCRDRDIPFVLKECDVAKLAAESGLGTEEMGRNLRYKFFAEELDGDKGLIAVAHNMNAKAETMLFNLARGTGAKGLASIPPKRPGLIRPLLCVTREEILSYLESVNVNYCTDQSNLTDDYTRNRIRNNILPLFREQVSKDIVEHMSETADQLRELNSFAEEYAEEVLNTIIRDRFEGHISVDRNLFLLQKPYIRKVIAKKLIDVLVPLNKDITHSHLESVEYIAMQQGNHKVNLPYGIVFMASYDTLSAEITSENRDEMNYFSCPLNVEGETDAGELGKYRCSITKVGKSFNISKEKYTKCFDYDKVKKTVEIRTRLQGDRIAINGEGGTKKLKSFYIDEKIPEEQRDRIPVLADGNDIIWIVGHRISEAYKVTGDTREILTITCMMEGE